MNSLHVKQAIETNRKGDASCLGLLTIPGLRSIVHAIIIAFASAFFLGANCCEESSYELPTNLQVEEAATEATYYQQVDDESFLSAEMKSVQSCDGFDGLISGKTMYVTPNFDEARCGVTATGTGWPNSFSRDLAVSSVDVCPHSIKDRGCWPFVRDYYDLSGNVRATLAVSFYSDVNWPEDIDSDFDDSRFGRGEMGEAPPVVIVRTYESPDKEYFPFPDDFESDEDGKYRCADVFYGYYEDI
jgi:hypothetical protein